jgi:hypothetical protein
MFSNLPNFSELDIKSRARVVQAEGLIAIVLPSHVKSFLAALPESVRMAALQILLHNPRRFLQIVWHLASLPDAEACRKFLSTITLSGEILDLPEKPADVTPLENYKLPPGLVANLRSTKPIANRNAQKMIRKDDNVFDESQTLVYAPFIRQNREAIRALVKEASQCEAIFSIERGGSLVADHLMALLRDRTPNVKLPKVYKSKTTTKAISINNNNNNNNDGSGESQLTIVKTTSEYSKWDHLENFKNAIRSRIAKSEQPLTIAVTESLVSGGSANAILDAVSTLLNENPSLTVHCFFERHTFHQGGDLGGDLEMLTATEKSQTVRLFAEGKDVLSIPPIPMHPQRLLIFIAKARYILGEDVGYQLAYSGPDAGQPIVIFNEVLGEVRAIQVQPSGGHTAREILTRIVLGAYDDLLRELGIIPPFN